MRNQQKKKNIQILWTNLSLLVIKCFPTFTAEHFSTFSKTSFNLWENKKTNKNIVNDDKVSQ